VKGAGHSVFPAAALLPVNRGASTLGTPASAAVIKITSLGCSGFTGRVRAGARAGRQPKVYLAGRTFGGRSAGTKCGLAADRLIKPGGGAGHRWTC